MPMVCWIKWLRNGQPILQPQGLGWGCETGRSRFKRSRIAKRVGTLIPFATRSAHWLTSIHESTLQRIHCLYKTLWDFMVLWSRGCSVNVGTEVSRSYPLVRRGGVWSFLIVFVVFKGLSGEVGLWCLVERLVSLWSMLLDDGLDFTRMNTPR